MKKTKFLIGALAAFVLCSVSADEAFDVVAKSASLPVPFASQSNLAMDLYKNGKLEEHRVIRQIGRKNSAGLKETIFDFREPNSVKDTRLLQAEKSAKDDDKWIYLPSLRTTRRIAAAERQKSFVGSDFTYNDMTIRQADEDTHEMINANASKTVAGNSYNCWEIKSTPIKKNVEFSYRNQWIDKKSLLPVYVEYYDKKGALLKIQSIEKIAYIKSEANDTVYTIRMFNRLENVQTKHTTTVAVINAVYDGKVKDSYFTQSWLNTGKY